MHRLHTLCGVSTGLSGAALLEWARRVDWPSAIAAAGSVIATVVGWILARRAEITRQSIELARETREAARAEQLAAIMFEIRKRQLESGATIPCEPPATSSPPSSSVSSGSSGSSPA